MNTDVSSKMCFSVVLFPDDMEDDSVLSGGKVRCLPTSLQSCGLRSVEYKFLMTCLNKQTRNHQFSAEQNARMLFQSAVTVS